MKNVFNHLNLLHLLNDGFFASLFIILPFISEDIAVNLSEAGVLGSLLRISTFAFVVPFSFLASKLGSFKLLLGALFLYATATFIAGFATSYEHLLIIFFLAGLGFSSFHAQSYGLVAKLADREKRNELLGNVSTAGEIGKLLFTSLTTLAIGYMSWRYFLKFSGLAGIAICIAMILLASKYFQHVFTVKVTTTDKDKKNGFKELFKEPAFRKVLAAASIDYFASGSLFMFLPFLLLDKGFDEKLVGSLTAVLFVGAILGKSSLCRVADKFGNQRLFVIAELSMMALIVSLAAFQSLPLIIITIILLGIVTKGTGPLLTILMVKSVDHLENYDKAISVSELTEKFLGTIAPALFGLIGDHFGINYSFYLMAGACVIASIPIALLTFKENPTNPNTNHSGL